MMAQRRRRWANSSAVLGERVVFDRLHTHRQRLTDSAERSQVKQHVSTSGEGRHDNAENIRAIWIDIIGR